MEKTFDNRPERGNTLASRARSMFLADGKSIPEIARAIGVDEDMIAKYVKNLVPPKRSKGEVGLLDILHELYPNHKIEEQVPFHGMYLDFYIPRLRICFEYDGIQHFKQSALYHKTGTEGAYNFEAGLARDRAKDRYAKDEYIYMIRIGYKTKLTTDNIRRIIDEHSGKIMDNLTAFISSYRTESEDL